MVPAGFFDWSKWMDTELYDLGLDACFLGFALFTHSLHYIYTCWSLSACSCSHSLTLSRSKQDFVGLSLSPLTSDQRAGRIRLSGREGGLTLSPSAREGLHYRRSYSLSPSGSAGGPPTPSSSPPYIVWVEWPPVAHRTIPQEP